MIWQLVKRDPRWRGAIAFMSVVSPLVAAAAAYLPLPPHVSTRHEFGIGLGMLLSFETGFMILLFASLQSARDWFEAALPISGRDAWGSRVLSLLTLIWSPALIGIACGLPPSPLVDAGSIYTVLVLGVKSVRTGEIGAPLRLRRFVIVSLQVLVFGDFLLMQLKRAQLFSWPHTLAWLPLWIVLSVCGLASAALFRWAWSTVPQSLRIAPLKLPQSHSRVRKEPEFLWAPVLRSTCGGASMLWLFGFVVPATAAGWTAITGVLAAIPLIGVRHKCRWLLALPVSPRMVFGLIAAAPAAAVVIGSVANAFFNIGYSLAPRERITAFATDLVLVYLTIFLTEIPAWRPLSKFPAWLRWLPYASAWIIPPLVFGDMSDVQKLAAMLPADWWQLTAVLAIPAIASYWLAEKAFIGQEYHRTLLESFPNRRSTT